jgi:hypothetical protein
MRGASLSVEPRRSGSPTAPIIGVTKMALARLK